MRRFMVFFVLSFLSVALQSHGGELDVLPLGDSDLAFVLGSGHTGEIIESATGEVVTLETMVRKMASARVVLIGEEHTHLGQKRFQARVLEALAEVQPNLVLGMEFFRRSDNDALQRWINGEIDDDGLLRESEWYDRGTYRWGYYEEMMDVARQRAIPVYGLNIPREIPRTVNRRGLEALDADQKVAVGEVVVDNSAQHRYLIGRYFGDTVAMMPPRWFGNMYAAQCLWDTVMARSILDVLPEDGTVVVVVGSGHVAFDLGIVRRISEELAAGGKTDIEVATFCPIQAAINPEGSDEPSGHPMGGDREGDTRPQAVFTRSMADFVGVFEATGGVDAWPSLGLKLKEGEAGEPTVSIAWPDGRGEAAGFETGDVIVDFNGIEPKTLSDLRMMLAGLEWGDRADLRVRRGDEVTDIAMLMVPGPVQEERLVAPGWTVEPVDAITPESAEVVTAAEDGPEKVAVLQSNGETIRWVVVWLDGVAQELHFLDDSNRVSRSKYLLPLEDGAVEIIINRDSQGHVVSTNRFSRGGQPAPQ